MSWILDRITSVLMKRATPYFHLPGYMMRWWLVPYNVVITRTFEATPLYAAFTTTDGTGMVSFWKRPFTWLIQKCGIAIRVHEILRSDTGRDPHDHPWPYLTIILKGGYFETQYNAAGDEVSGKWHGPGSILYRPANSWHRLDLLDGRSCTTIFITGKKCQTWGFLASGKKVPYYEYLDGGVNGGRKA